GDGVLEVRLGCAGGARAALGIEREEGDPGGVDAAAHGRGVDPTHRQRARLLRRLARPQPLDDEQAAADPPDLLADARGPGGAGVSSANPCCTANSRAPSPASSTCGVFSMPRRATAAA